MAIWRVSCSNGFAVLWANSITGDSQAMKMKADEVAL
jgi:hypothetical protein